MVRENEGVVSAVNHTSAVQKDVYRAGPHAPCLNKPTGTLWYQSDELLVNHGYWGAVGGTLREPEPHLVQFLGVVRENEGVIQAVREQRGAE